MKKINCLIIDDEVPAIELIAKYASMIDQLEVVGTSQSAIKAFEMIADRPVDLLFLDIRMPGLNGIDFARSLKNPPSVILTTAYREYAIDGFELDVIDYLLKPIEFSRFLKSIDRYRSRIISAPLYESKNSEDDDYIFFNINKTRHKIVLRDILYIESLKDYVRVHSSIGNLVVKGNIGSIMKRLPAHRFVRIHRSYAIALPYIKSYNQREVDLKGVKLPIGVSYRNNVNKILNDNSK